MYSVVTGLWWCTLPGVTLLYFHVRFTHAPLPSHQQTFGPLVRVSCLLKKFYGPLAVLCDCSEIIHVCTLYIYTSSRSVYKNMYVTYAVRLWAFDLDIIYYNMYYKLVLMYYFIVSCIWRINLQNGLYYILYSFDEKKKKRTIYYARSVRIDIILYYIYNLTQWYTLQMLRYSYMRPS